MSNKIKSTFQFVLGILILLGLGYIFYLVTKELIKLFSGLNKDIAAAIIAASVTIILSVISIVLTKILERRSEIVRELRLKKIPIYEELIKFWFNVLFASKAGKQPPSEKEIVIFLNDFTQKLIIWGSDGVLKYYTIFRDKLINADANKITAAHFDGMFIFEKLMLEMRKDLGHKNKNILKGDILSLFINDIKKYI